MYAKRFIDDGKNIYGMIPVQTAAKTALLEKLSCNEYKCEEVPCVICGRNQFEQIAAKDRYGISFPTVICLACGLVQANPRMDEVSYEKFYNNEYRLLYSGSDEANLAAFNSQYIKGEKIFEFLKDKLNHPLSEKNVLEIGCAMGGILKFFQDKGNMVLGIDVDTNIIKYGKDKMGMNLRAAKLTDMDVDSTKYDIVILSHVLEHILNPVSFMQQLKKHLKIESIIYVEVPGIFNLYHTYQVDILRYIQNAHVYYFNRATLINVMGKAGYSTIYANEFVKGIFNLQNSASNNKLSFSNNYACTKHYILRLEYLRFLPFDFYNTKRLGAIIWSKGILQLMRKISSRLGIYDFARLIYRKLKKTP